MLKKPCYLTGEEVKVGDRIRIWSGPGWRSATVVEIYLETLLSAVTMLPETEYAIRTDSDDGDRWSWRSFDEDVELVEPAT